jgi:hypothetical protein
LRLREKKERKKMKNQKIGFSEYMETLVNTLGSYTQLASDKDDILVQVYKKGVDIQTRQEWKSPESKKAWRDIFANEKTCTQEAWERYVIRVAIQQLHASCLYASKLDAEKARYIIDGGFEKFKRVVKLRPFQWVNLYHQVLIPNFVRED